MKKIVLSVLAIFLITIFAQAQMPVSDLNRSTHAKQLREGMLFVQLPNSDKKIEKLKEMGNRKEAKKEQKEVNKTRADIIKGFKEEFHFCNYVFIETDQVKEILKGNYKNAFDENLQKITDLPSFEHAYIVRYGTGNPNGEVYRYNGLGFQIRYINNQQLETIKYDTFFVSRTPLRFFSLLKKQGINRLVSTLNSKLRHVKIIYNY